MEALKAVIIEDQRFSLELIKGCASEVGLNVVATEMTGEAGLEAFASFHPEIVLLDLDLPDYDGLAVAEKILNENPKTRILAISSKADEYTLYRVLRSGVFGFVDKTVEGISELKHALKEIIEWRPYYAAKVHQLNLSQLADPNAFPKILTEREIELLKLFGVGLNDQQIGQRKRISPATVKRHRHNILAKLELNSTPELIQYALKKGFARVSQIPR